MASDEVLDALTQLRLEKGWTYEATARRLKLPLGTVYRWIRRERTPNDRNVYRLQQFLAKHGKAAA